MAETSQSSRENQETLQSNTQAEEPAQSPVERVTEKVKDPRKVAAGRAGAAARKAKQEERLLEQLRAAKESFRPPAGEASIPPKEADSKDQEHTDKRPEHNREVLTSWTPWIIGACLTGGDSSFFETRKQEVPRRWRQAPLTLRPSSLWISPLGQTSN